MELIDKKAINLSGINWWLPDAKVQVTKEINKTPIIAKIKEDKSQRIETLSEILQITDDMNAYELRQLLYAARNIHRHYRINKIYCEEKNDKGSI